MKKMKIIIKNLSIATKNISKIFKSIIDVLIKGIKKLILIH